MKNNSTSYARLLITSLTLFTILLLGCNQDNKENFSTQNSSDKVFKHHDVGILLEKGGEDYWRRLPAIGNWGAFFSPILGLPEAELQDWCIKAGEMHSFRDMNSRVRIPDTELGRLKSGEIQLFDCTPYLIDEPLIEALCNSPNLIGLRIGPREESESFEWIAMIPKLRVLDIGTNDFSASGLSWLAEVSSLESLSIAKCKLPHATVNWLPVSPDLLDFIANDVVFSDEHLRLMPECPKLQRVSLYSAVLTDNGFQQIPRIAESLEYLWLARCQKLTPASFPTFGRLKNLRLVHLGSTDIEKTEYRSYHGGGGGVPVLEAMLPNCFFLYGT